MTDIREYKFEWTVLWAVFYFLLVVSLMENIAGVAVIVIVWVAHEPVGEIVHNLRILTRSWLRARICEQALALDRLRNPGMQNAG